MKVKNFTALITKRQEPIFSTKMDESRESVLVFRFIRKMALKVEIQNQYAQQFLEHNPHLKERSLCFEGQK